MRFGSSKYDVNNKQKIGKQNNSMNQQPPNSERTILANINGKLTSALDFRKAVRQHMSGEMIEFIYTSSTVHSRIKQSIMNC